MKEPKEQQRKEFAEFQRRCTFKIGRRTSSLWAMKWSRLRLEWINRVIRIIRHCYDQSLVGRNLIALREIARIGGGSAQVARDLLRIGVVLSDPVVTGQMIVLFAKVGAIKGGLAKADYNYRAISAAHARWCSGRGKFGPSNPSRTISFNPLEKRTFHGWVPDNLRHSG